ncbi:hypothetical protein L1987_46469 [Smallanthus sonchifolius]|uniref:Uncharacterized protein n=1 Tax=Smallanthus sonchifolius TaxID=185202 RepID=A0ACB9G0W3_9ASTR|nr:hypothetical protein L1987_46469 [Smallanthus sonchifolius]
MSTDLQLLRDLPAIRLTSLKIKLPAIHPAPEESCTVQSSEEEEEVENCQTPTSSEHKIPEITTCPPAPKKQRLSAPSCKRRISEFELFEIVARDEIESFFKSGYEFINRNSITNKRRCSPP